MSILNQLSDDAERLKTLAELRGRVVESLYEGVIVAYAAKPDAEGEYAQEDGLILYANERARKMYGYPYPLDGGETWVEHLIPEKYRKPHLSHRRQYADSPVAQQMGHRKLPALKHDGSIIYLDLALGYIPWRGKETVRCGSFDIASVERLMVVTMKEVKPSDG